MGAHPYQAFEDGLVDVFNGEAGFVVDKGVAAVGLAAFH